MTPSVAPLSKCYDMLDMLDACVRGVAEQAFLIPKPLVKVARTGKCAVGGTHEDADPCLRNLPQVSLVFDHSILGCPASSSALRYGLDLGAFFPYP